MLRRCPVEVMCQPSNREERVTLIDPSAQAGRHGQWKPCDARVSCTVLRERPWLKLPRPTHSERQAGSRRLLTQKETVTDERSLQTSAYYQ